MSLILLALANVFEDVVIADEIVRNVQKMLIEYLLQQGGTDHTISNWQYRLDIAGKDVTVDVVDICVLITTT